MGVLGRFKDIMASNINAWRNSKKHTENEIRQQMDSLQKDLRDIDAEFNAYEMNEKRVRRELADAKAEVGKFRKYVERAEADSEEERKEEFQINLDAAEKKQDDAQTRYDKAAAELDQMTQMREKRQSDIMSLRNDLGEKNTDSIEYAKDIQDAYKSLGKSEEDQQMEDLMKKYE